MSDNLFYKMKSGKPIKFFFYLRKYLGLAIPDFFYRINRQRKLREIEKRPDSALIKERADYYMRINTTCRVSNQDEIEHGHGWMHYTGTIGNYRRKMFHTVYYFDQHDVTRWFPPCLRWSFCPGDVYFTPKTPTVVKSRLLTADNQNSVLLKLDKLRHFMYVYDTKAFGDKKDCAIFRGKIRSSRLRTKFLEMLFDRPMFDCGVVGKNEGCPEEWMTEKKTIDEHLDYMFIMALEGNDVASNLKWVMSSNSIAVMPRPTCETWFMEGKLIPDYHYIETKTDFSDLEDKLSYYSEHIDEAQLIIEHAHEYVNQFRDSRREELISLMVLDKYFRVTEQSI